MTDLVPPIGTETPVDDTTRADGTAKQATELAPQVLPEAIARLVVWYLTRDYVVYQDDVANAVLALPAPVPAVDREGLIGLIADASNHNPFPEAEDIADALIEAGLVR